jgi:Flp pilus assembly pilin Flp
LLKCRTGAVAIEYALVAVVISIAFISIFVVMGGNLTDIFQSAADGFPAQGS